MATKIETARALLGKWRDCGLKVGDAISVRDFDKCRRADAEARGAFSELVGILDKELSLELKQEILDGVELWAGNVEAMPDWLAETKDELESVKSRLSVRRKLGGVYASKAAQASDRSGLRLKIKAR